MNAPPYRFLVLAVAVVGFVQTHVHRMAFAPLIPTFVGDLGAHVRGGPASPTRRASWAA